MELDVTKPHRFCCFCELFFFFFFNRSSAVTLWVRVQITPQLIVGQPVSASLICLLIK